MTALLFRDDAYLSACRATVIAVDARGIRLDRTVFYPNGGGQPGDTGSLCADGVAVAITDTIKGEAVDEVIHTPAPDAALPVLGAPVEATIDWVRRYRLMRMHTLLHLVVSQVPGSITGAQVGADRSRVDFNVPTQSLDKPALEQALNRLIEEDRPVTAQWISDQDLADNPALVRTLTVKPPTGSGRVRMIAVDGVDLQPCGGTHVARTGEIGPVQVVRIENKGKQNRRVVVTLRD